jgi:hypothetical protein
MEIGTLIGILASTIAVGLWLFTFHRRFFISLLKTQKVTAYGVYAGWGEACRTHFWYLIRGLFRPSPTEEDRVHLEEQVKRSFHEQFGRHEDGNIMITHSCRSIFYYVIRSLIDKAKQKNEHVIRICLPSLHFGSFYRMLGGIEKSEGVVFQYCEVDFHSNDWSLNEDSVDEDEFKRCDLLICQHVFGVPFPYRRLPKLAKKYNIPILEDCVQSGSLPGNYRGLPESDIIMYSGGLDKTPPCFGAGFGFFRKTTWGNDMYQHCCVIHDALPVDTWQKRFVTCVLIMLHLMIAKNSFGFNNLMGLIAYVWVTNRGDFINWYAMSFKIRNAKAITPFQHKESGFLRKPSTYQLQSMLYGLSRKDQLTKMAQHELKGRDLLLSSIPSQYHEALFPWLTSEVLARYKKYEGVSEFAWVVSPIGDRTHLCEFLNAHFIVLLVNTTWEISQGSKLSVGKHINDNLVYLPNINEMNESQIINVGKMLTLYCQHLERNGEYDFSQPSK